MSACASGRDVHATCYLADCMDQASTECVCNGVADIQGQHDRAQQKNRRCHARSALLQCTATSARSSFLHPKPRLCNCHKVMSRKACKVLFTTKQCCRTTAIYGCGLRIPVTFVPDSCILLRYFVALCVVHQIEHAPPGNCAVALFSREAEASGVLMSTWV